MPLGNEILPGSSHKIVTRDSNRREHARKISLRTGLADSGRKTPEVAYGLFVCLKFVGTVLSHFQIAIQTTRATTPPPPDVAK